MDNVTRRGRMIRELNHSFIPFSFIRKFTIRTKDGRVFHGKTESDFKKFIDELAFDKSSSLIDISEPVSDIAYFTNDMKIKKAVKKSIEPLFSKYFDIK